MFAWMYLWPVGMLLSVSVLGVFLFLAMANLLLGLGVVSLYGLCPKDPLFASIAQQLRNKVVEENLQETFQLEVRYPLPSVAIYIWSPHALLSVSSVMFNIPICRHPRYVPNHLVTLPVYHYIPVLSDIMRYMNVISSDYHSIEKTLLKKESVSLMLGGVREMNMTEDYKIQLCIRKRRGLFRIALSTGTPLVPVLSYGENEMFQRANIPAIHSLNEFLYSRFGTSISIPSFYSLRNWIDLSYRSLKPIRSYTGKPIYVKKIANPTEKEIVALRNLYIKRIEELFRETASPEYSLHIE